MAQDQSPQNTAATPEATGDEPRGESLALGYLVVGAVIYFTVVWRALPDSPTVKWTTTGVLAGLAAASLVVARKWGWFQRRFSAQARVVGWWTRVAGDFLVIAMVVVAVLLAAIYLRNEDQVLLLKLFAVLYFSLLPALLYLQFNSRKAQTVWREYVLNLYQLHIDDYAHLPRPPTLSRFNRLWREAREQRAGKQLPEKAPDSQNLEKANLYRRKFADLFGTVLDEDPSLISLRSPHKLQVMVTTVLVAIGWVFVVQPETVFARSLTPRDFQLAGLPTIPRETLAFAFLGAYFYILQMLVRRYFQGDLKSGAYVNATMRIIIVMLLVWTIDPLLEGTASQAERSALAFVIGVFPSVGWQALNQGLVKLPFRRVVPVLRQDYPLSDLDGLNIWYESRLLEEGIEDMQNLATADLVDVLLKTRIPVERLVDWVDQSLLYLHCAKEENRNGKRESDRQTLRRYGIRTATDLIDAFDCKARGTNGKSFRDDIERLLNYTDDGTDDGRASVTRSILATLQRERNLQYVMSWKSFKSDDLDDPATPLANGSTPAPKARASGTNSNPPTGAKAVATRAVKAKKSAATTATPKANAARRAGSRRQAGRRQGPTP